MTNQRKKKILYVITKSNWGGAQRYVFDLATNLNPETVEVAVALGGTGELKKKLQKNNIRCISLPQLERNINIFKEVLLFFTLYKLYHSEHPDIIHLNSSKIGAVGSLVGRIYNLLTFRRAKIIFTAHGWAFEEDRNILARKIIFLLSWITIVASHATIAVSEHHKHAVSMPLVSKKIFTIHNGIIMPNLSSPYDARKTILSALPNLSQKTRDFLQNPGTRWIGTIGELHQNKGYPYALYAINTLTVTFPNIAYIIIGGGEQREDIERYICDESLHNHVFLTGHISNAEKYIRAFDIFLLPSVKEGLPYVLLESAHAQVPIVATSVGGIPEIIQHKNSGTLARPKSSKELRECLTYMLIDKYRRQKMGENLCTTARKLFTLDLMLEKTWKLYRHVLRPRPLITYSRSVSDFRKI